MNTGYNGWTNYATWRINLEFGFSDLADHFTDYDAKVLEEYVKESLELDCNNKTTLDYALAFIADVNWDEIVDSIQDYSDE